MDNADELQVIGEKDIYVQSVEDIPQGAKLLESVAPSPTWALASWRWWCSSS